MKNLEKKKKMFEKISDDFEEEEANFSSSAFCIPFLLSHSLTHSLFSYNTLRMLIHFILKHFLKNPTRKDAMLISRMMVNMCTYFMSGLYTQWR